MGKIEPKHCPSCGSENIHNQELESNSDTSELYDTYCRNCKWSGDISPDLPLINKKTLQEIISTLKTLKPSLIQQYGIESIGVFGSYAKGEQTPRSDIDILVTFKQDAHPRPIRVYGTRRVLNQTTWHKSGFGNKGLA